MHDRHSPRTTVLSEKDIITVSAPRDSSEYKPEQRMAWC
jgi:hypothetical protein